MAASRSTFALVKWQQQEGGTQAAVEDDDGAYK